MQSKKINLATMQSRLSRDEMKKIMGGADFVDPGGGGCLGIISCIKDNEGLNCNIADQPTCVCKKSSDGYYCD